MKTAVINTPLGCTEICGDEIGISKIHILNDETEISTKIPKELKEAVSQLQDYFNGRRTDFTFKINPLGTDFQKKVWQELLHIPFGKTCSYLELLLFFIIILCFMRASLIKRRYIYIFLFMFFFTASV